MAHAASRTKSKKLGNRPHVGPTSRRQLDVGSVYRHSHRSTRWLLLLLTLLVAIATLTLYFPVHHDPFLLNYDDSDYITKNPRVQDGLKADTVIWAFTTYDTANWHPLTWLSHAVDCQLFGLDPAGHHDTNLLLHMLNAVLLLSVLAQATGYLGRSAMVAALFALHPINVESVAWVAERKNLLSMTFFLLALGAWRWYARKPRAWRYAVVAALYALGLMSKAQVVTFPFVLLLWDYWPLQRVLFSGDARTQESKSEVICPQKHPLWLLAEKLPLLLLSAADAWLTIKAEGLGGINPDGPLTARFANAVVSYARYVVHAFWPAHLSIHYPFRGSSLRGWTVAASVILLIAITTAVIACRRIRFLPVGWLWFLGTLVPMIGLVRVGHYAMADRYAYLTFIGLFLLVCWGATDLANRLRIPLVWQTGGSLLVLLALAVTARQQLSLWSDNVRLWTNATEVTQDNFVAEDNLGLSLRDAGKPGEAMAHFSRSALIEPSYPYPYIHMGIYLHKQGDLQSALQNYQKAISLTGNDYHYAEVRYYIFVNMASAYASSGDLAQARDCLAAALRVNPDHPEEWTNLGILAQKTGELDTAAWAYSQAVKLQPSQRGYLMLEDALRQAGKEQEAEAAAQEAALQGNGPH